MRNHLRAFKLDPSLFQNYHWTAFQKILKTLRIYLDNRMMHSAQALNKVTNKFNMIMAQLLLSLESTVKPFSKSKFNQWIRLTNNKRNKIRHKMNLLKEKFSMNFQ